SFIHPGPTRRQRASHLPARGGRRSQSPKPRLLSNRRQTPRFNRGGRRPPNHSHLPRRHWQQATDQHRSIVATKKHKSHKRFLNPFVFLCLFVAGKIRGKNRGGWPQSDHPPNCRGWGLMGAELVAVEIFFLQEPHRHHAILLEPAIKFAAVDAECGCGTHLVSTKLL